MRCRRRKGDTGREQETKEEEKRHRREKETQEVKRRYRYSREKEPQEEKRATGERMRQEEI